MDILYVGDIPQSYHFALFNNGYVDLYNVETLINGTYDFYRVYTNAGGFYYRHMSTNYSQYNTTTAQNITVTDNVCYRTDFSNILFLTLAFTFIGVWFLNLLTSCVRKGGILGGFF